MELYMSKITDYLRYYSLKKYINYSKMLSKFASKITYHDISKFK
jgi:hypothetical protein